MKTQILDIFSENTGSVCYLSKARLRDYITSLPSDYKNNDVQREIISHIYLDNLIHSLFEGKHIPPIVLIDNNVSNSKVGDERILKDFKILDGLQRTYRLKYLYDTIEFFLQKDLQNDFLNKNRLQLSKLFKGDLFKINSNITILSKLIDYAKLNSNYINDFKDIYDRSQWFEVWQNLSPSDEVNKMLILNAGHKAVSPKHQIELLFSYALPILSELANNEKLSIIREKEKNSIRFSKERKEYQFHLSHMITGLLCYYEGKILTSNAALIQKQQNDEEYAANEVFMDSALLQLFLETLLNLDQKLIETFNVLGVKWLGREVSLVGMFGALGRFKITAELSHKEAFSVFRNLIINNSKVLNISEFEEVRNSQALSKINIGMVNKRAVFNATLDVLNNHSSDPIKWRHYFQGGTNDN